MNNIGIIGKGFVGTAVALGFSAATGAEFNVLIYDKNLDRSLNSLQEVLDQSDFIFISVPTPSNADGTISLNILTTCLDEINEYLSTIKNNPIILIRSTVIPGTTNNLQNLFPKLNLVFNPEFLTERSANFDFISQTRYILGGEPDLTDKVASLYKMRFGKHITIIETDFQTAELIKYMCNTFFATKVSFLNEMYQLSENLNLNWDKALQGFVSDGRVGHSHVNVPGHDGKLGFGGSCFPKDIQALIHYADSQNINLNVLKGAWETNLEVRPERDWENLKGRAVVEELESNKG
jgi:nucleotide sugar dehydrogenase